MVYLYNGIFIKISMYSTPRGGSPQPGAGDEPLPGTSSGTGRGGRARSGSRGSRRGRGSRCARTWASRGVRRGTNVGWLRGERLIERFRNDEELPEHLRLEFERLMNTRSERERARRVRAAVSVDMAENESDVENHDYFEAEEFVWTGMDGWNGSKESFCPETSGPTVRVSSVYDAFRCYWDDSLLSQIAAETNRYAQGIQGERFRRQWYETNVDEILMLFAFWMMLGIHKMPTIKSCFTKSNLLKTEIFRAMFTEDRYWNLNRAFHLASGTRDANDPGNVLYPMGPVLKELNKKFQENYRPYQDICIDESLTLWKGPVGFKQYIKTKAARFGIKSYELCESSSGYLWSFFIYTGRGTLDSTLPSSVSTVLKLIEPLLGLGHVVYMDNWFNSPMLARYLKKKNTDCVGTLRPSRKNVPVTLQRAPLAEGQFLARQSGDIMIVALQDRKRVTCLSTFHNIDQVLKEARPGRPSSYKLQIIEDYNKGMGGVDRLDQMLEPYLVERKQCVKWTRKLFKRLLNITIQNSRIILDKSTNSNNSSLSFRLALVQSIFDKHRSHVPLRNPDAPPPRQRTTPRTQFPPERLTERHFIRRILVTAEIQQQVRHQSNQGRRQCVWCTVHGRRNKKTVYECPQCNVALCLESCFEQFHTVP